MPRRYRGHRADSFTPGDIQELVEVRARKRTFEGAYRRTAVGNLSYSLTILRLFDPRFYRIGLLYAIFAILMLAVSFLRNRHSRHDFADYSNTRVSKRPIVLKTLGQEGKRIFGRPFVTAGSIVVLVTSIVAGMEITLLVLILKL